MVLKNVAENIGKSPNKNDNDNERKSSSEMNASGADNTRTRRKSDETFAANSIRNLVGKTTTGPTDGSDPGSVGLFNIVREACALQNVKWPMECQVRQE